MRLSILELFSILVFFSVCVFGVIYIFYSIVRIRKDIDQIKKQMEQFSNTDNK